MSFMRYRVRFLVTALLLTSVLFTTAAATGQAATVTASALRLRSEPNLGAPVLSVAKEGSEVTVLSEAANGWYEVQYRDQKGFMSSYYLNLREAGTDGSDDPLMAYVNTGASVLNVRSGPGTTYSVLGKAKSGTLLPVLSTQDGWYEVSYDNQSAYVSVGYVLLMTQSEYDAMKNQNSAQGNEIVAYAKQFIGYPYVYGGNGPNSFDCSGFVKYIYAQFGYTLNRTATDQLKNGIEIPLDSVQPGDLVFFRASGTVKPVSHVGLYVGDGQFIHASTTTKGVRYDNLFTGYYSNIYVYARRII